MVVSAILMLFSGEPTTITIPKVDAAKLVSGNTYFLYVKGESTANQVLFEKKELLRYDGKALSIFIQTDKAIYKPGTEGWGRGELC